MMKIVFDENECWNDAKIGANVDDKSLRFGVDSVISHEMVHQWTGNLVTCAW